MKHIDKKIKQINRRFGIKSTPSADTLRSILKKLGYTLQPYTAVILEDFGEHIPPAYTYEYNGLKVVYYDNTLSENDLLIAFSHELAHIVLNHAHRHDGPEDTATYQDYESDVFVYKFLTYRNNRKQNITFIVSLVLCFSSLVYSSLLMRQDKTTTNIASPAEFVITTSGDKYHNPHCYVVKYKTNIIHVSETEAEQLGKEPCDICIIN